MLRWPAQDLAQALAAELPGCELEVLAQIDSTNTELMRRARAGRLQPALLVAEAQTAGRGRLGRAWDGGAAAGDVLMFSLGLPVPVADCSGLSLAVGLSLAQSLHPQLRIKWPNDLWWQDRKLAGVLIETAQWGAQRHAVIGVGLNIRPRPAADWATPPAWLQELLPEADAPQALQRLALPLVRDVQRFFREGFAPFAAGYAARDALRGRAVRLSDGTTGRAEGVDGRGALLVHTAQGVRAIDSAEVSVRPSP